MFGGGEGCEVDLDAEIVGGGEGGMKRCMERYEVSVR